MWINKSVRINHIVKNTQTCIYKIQGMKQFLRHLISHPDQKQTLQEEEASKTLLSVGEHTEGLQHTTVAQSQNRKVGSRDKDTPSPLSLKKT